MSSEMSRYCSRSLRLSGSTCLGLGLGCGLGCGLGLGLGLGLRLGLALGLGLGLRHLCSFSRVLVRLMAPVCWRLKLRALIFVPWLGVGSLVGGRVLGWG